MRSTFLISPLVFANQTDHCSTIHLPNVQVLSLEIVSISNRRAEVYAMKIPKYKFRMSKIAEMLVAYQMTVNVILIPKHLKFAI